MLSEFVDAKDRDDCLARICRMPRVDGSRLPLLDAYVAALLAETSHQNLIARSTISNVWSRHILDSAQLINLVPRETRADSWVDIGSGAGLPGVVCAILLPKCEFILVEPRVKRVEFLRCVADRLALTNICIEASTVQNVVRNRVDIISARAVAVTDKIVAIAGHLADADTYWLLPKGRGALAELDGMVMPHAFHVEHSVTDPESGVIVGTIPSLSGKSGS
ncbi:16S rRNA (guanine(527)-N(7))-methyltransferase RsmG [Croceicoccus hydrothermalis]|uniref:16S rRNA (guanine(527)-N(7))-methyltransferase RsmG n=1 Tax=Croceicoccus hydrothermalis TaxID=2867964 RepID=UPI001EFADB12|nr:16S rRNA (guanine(527)-N(7))-methyltransferase RsmG [Croceicoccus hydrothermalis]